MTDGKWTVDRPYVRVDPIPIHLLPLEGARIQTNSEPPLDAQVAMQSKTTKGHKPTQIVAE